RYTSRIMGIGLLFFFLANISITDAAEENSPAETNAPKQQVDASAPAFDHDHASGDKIDPKNEAKKNYRIQAGDRLNLKIYPEDPYMKGGEFQVSPEGNITLALLGKVRVAGMTMKEAIEM